MPSSLRNYVPSIVILLFALVCTQIPLFNYLGFEFSGLASCVVAIVTGYVAIGVWKQQAASGKTDIGEWFRRVGARAVPLVLIPFVTQLSNALFVRNCSVSQGVAFYFVNVVPATCLFAALALLVSVVSDRWTKTILTAVFVLLLLHIPLVSFVSTHIFAFNPLVGFFPGFTYDEALDVLPRLALYRSGTLAAGVTIVSASFVITTVRRRRERAGAKPLGGMLLSSLTGGICLVYASWMFFGSDELGLSSSGRHVRDQLGGATRTRHFEIVYPRSVVDDRQAEEIGELHEYYYDLLSRELGVEPRGKVASFLYKDPKQKERLFGAGQTDVTKPWLRQIHINLSDVSSSLKHELVHIFAAEFGVTPFKLGANPGLMEGLAVAVERRSSYETLSDAAASAVAVGVSPQIELLFSYRGFMTSSPAVSYTLAGSFCRYLIDQFGIDRFKTVYQTGDFGRVYGRDLSALAGLWRQQLRDVPVAEGARLKARFLFKRVSIFQKVCARVIANLNQRAREQFAQRKFREALEAADRSLRLSRSTEAVILQISSRFRMKQYDSVTIMCRAYLSDSTLTDALLPTRLQLADSYWSMDSTEAAKRELSLLLSAHLSSAYDEACRLRLAALNSLVQESFPSALLFGDVNDSMRVVQLDSLSNRTGVNMVSHSLSAFLAGRSYLALGKYAESLGALKAVSPFDDGWLNGMLHRRTGLSLFHLKRFAEARDQFARSDQFMHDDVSLLESHEWKERCEWSMRGEWKGSSRSSSGIH